MPPEGTSVVPRNASAFRARHCIAAWSASDSSSERKQPMLGHYFALALRSLRRNPVLTALMISAIGVGISASMTTLTVYRGMDADPIPQKARDLFAPQIDNWGPHPAFPGARFADHLADQMSYTDVMNLMRLQGARQQTAMYQTGFVLTPSDPKIRPFNVLARATYHGFFSMFEVPFRYGGDWTATDDQNRAPVAVLSRELNEKLFDGANSVGREIRLNGVSYRIVGVLGKWRPVPRFYDLNGNPYGKTANVFVPFTNTIERHARTTGNLDCNKSLPPGWDRLLRSDCVWLQFWVELPTAADVKAYRALLVRYAAQQRSLGHFHWPPHVQLRDVPQWLSYHHLVSDEVRILTLLSFAFLVICLLNALALMLAKLLSRSGEFGVRRALGASRPAVAIQCTCEAATIGLAGGLLGFGLTALSFAGLRALLSSEGRALLHLDGTAAIVTILLAVAVTILVGLYPTWKAVRLPPTLQLKAD